MKDIYKISIIIPTYNRRKLLSYTLESLLKQKAQRKIFEVIICDDGSTDGTKQMVEKYQHEISLKYVFQEDKGYRVASARNLGIKVAQGRICLFIDSGVLLHGNCILEHINFHNESPNSAAIGYVYGFEEDNDYSNILEQLIIPSNPDLSIKRLALNSIFHDLREKHYVGYDYKIEYLPAPWLYFWTCHVSVLRKHLVEINYFDEDYDGKWGVEDNDLGFRLHQKKVKILLLKSAQAIHYPHKKNKSDLHQEGYHNCRYFHDKFQTVTTKLFLDNFLNKEFTDINKYINVESL